MINRVGYACFALVTGFQRSSTTLKWQIRIVTKMFCFNTSGASPSLEACRLLITRLVFKIENLFYKEQLLSPNNTCLIKGLTTLFKGVQIITLGINYDVCFKVILRQQSIEYSPSSLQVSFAV